MRSFVATILLFTTSVVHAQLEVEHDRFTQQTVIKTETKAAVGRLKLDGKPALSLLGVYDTDGSLQISLFISSLGTEWRYLNCRRTNWLRDGRPLTMTDPIHNSDVLNSGRVSEDLIVRLTLAQLHQLADAQRVEYKVCNDEYIVSSEEMRDFRDMVRLLREHDPGRRNAPSP